MEENYLQHFTGLLVSTWMNQSSPVTVGEVSMLQMSVHSFSGLIMRFLASSLRMFTSENALSTCAFDTGTVSNRMAPSANCSTQQFPPASLKASTCNQMCQLWAQTKTLLTLRSATGSKVCLLCRKKNSIGKSLNAGLLTSDITDLGLSISSLSNISSDAARRSWYCASSSFKKLYNALKCSLSSPVENR